MKYIRDDSSHEKQTTIIQPPHTFLEEEQPILQGNAGRFRLCRLAELGKASLPGQHQISHDSMHTHTGTTHRAGSLDWEAVGLY